MMNGLHRLPLALAESTVWILISAAACTHPLRGVVHDLNYAPLPGAVIALEGTCIEATTNVTGRFLLRIPDQFLCISDSLLLRVGLAGSVLSQMTYPWSNWPELQICIPSPHPLLWDRAWAPPLFSYSSATVNLRPDSSIIDQLEGLRVFYQVGQVTHAYDLPAMEAGVISIGVPSLEDEVMQWGSPVIEDNELVFTSSFDHFTIVWSLPGIPDQMIDLQLASGQDTCLTLKPDESSDLSIIPEDVLPAESTWIDLCEQADGEWLAQGYRMDEGFLDPCAFGTDSLWLYGFVRCGTYWDEVLDGYQWRIVLVFHDHLVSIPEIGEPQLVPFEYEIFHAVLSPDGNQVLVFENTDESLRMESAVLINVAEGSSYRFTPAVHRTNVQTTYHRELVGEGCDPEHFWSLQPVYRTDMRVQINYPVYHYLVLDRGFLLAQTEEQTILYTPAYATREFSQIDTVQAILWPLGSSDGSELLAEIDEGENCSHTWILDSSGVRRYTSFDPFPWRVPPDYDRFSRRVLAESSEGTGLSMYELPDGNHLNDYPEIEGTHSIALSPGGGFFATRDRDFQYWTVYRSDCPDESLFRLRGSSEDRRVSLPVSMASCGRTLWELQHLDEEVDGLLNSRRRYMLIDQEGEVLWISPTRCSNLQYFDEKFAWWPWNGISCFDCFSISPDGSSFIWTDERLIHINHIEPVTEFYTPDHTE